MSDKGRSGAVVTGAIVVVTVAVAGTGPVTGSVAHAGGATPVPPAAVAAVASPVAPGAAAAAPQHDPRAVEIAEAVLERMGGRDAWNATRHLRWHFFGNRVHYWDKWTNDVRIFSPARADDPDTERDEAQPATLWLMNIDSLEGRVWRDGQEVTDPAALDELLTRGHQIWVNDSYWMFMPYKLLDPGVSLTHAGPGQMADGRAAQVLELTFDEGVGYTPDNKYLVYVADDSGLVEQWDYFQDASDPEPGITTPWTGWERFGEILLATSRGRDADWNIAVFEELPAAVYSDPDLEELP